MSDFIAIHFGMRVYRIFAVLFPIYTTQEQAANPDRMFEMTLVPFFIYWPLRVWRNIKIHFLMWAVRNREESSQERISKTLS